MANFNPCCCDSGCQGVIGYDLYNLQTQNFLPVYTDGERFNSFPVKYGLQQTQETSPLFFVYWSFDGLVTPEGFVVADLVENPYFTADLPFMQKFRKINFTDVDVYYKHSWNNPTNVNKDPVDTQWVNPLATTDTHNWMSARSVAYDFKYGALFGVPQRSADSTPMAGLYRGWAHPRPHRFTPDFFPKHSLSYGYLKEYTHSAPIAPYLFTSQPGRFVIQTHSELPGNHYIGINENGHVACLPYHESDPNYWASPGNHLVPKPKIINPTTGLPVTLKDVANGIGGLANRSTNLDYGTVMFEPFRSQPLYPRDLTTRDIITEGWLNELNDPIDLSKLIGILPEFDKGKYKFPPGFVYPQGTDYFADSTLLFDTSVGDPVPGDTSDTGRNRKVKSIKFLDIWKDTSFFGISDSLCPCASSESVYLPNTPTTETSVLWKPGNRVIGVNTAHPRTNMIGWFNKDVWAYKGDSATQTHWDTYRSFMPDRPAKYFKIPKRGKLFTGPLYPQNRWETAGAIYFGKYGTRGHTNWTQGAWLTWSGNTSAPTSLLTDPENKDYFDAEIAAFKKMVSCCAKETGKGTRCINGRWETDCNDLTTQVWKTRYPQQRCGGVTWDPPPPCGERKLIWAVYASTPHTKLVSFGDYWQTDIGIENGPPLAWGDFIINQDPNDFKNSTYEMVTRWKIVDYYKNRCYGFDAPGINTDPAGTGINASMSWKEMQGLEWTPLYPKQKSIQKQCMEDQFGLEPRQDTHYFFDVLRSGPISNYVTPIITTYNLSNLSANNPWSIRGLTFDLAITANYYGWFNSYKGFNAGTAPTFRKRTGASSETWGIDGNKFAGECGTPHNWFWEETSDDIFYNNLGSTNFVWLISCSVPQYHKAKDQPLTKGISGGFRAPIDGELTGLGWSKNMGLFHPCGNIFYGISGACGDEFFVGLSGASKSISSKYKECHGCTWANPPTWIGSGTPRYDQSQFWIKTPIKSSYWNLHYTNLGESAYGPLGDVKTGFNGLVIGSYSLSNSILPCNQKFTYNELFSEVWSTGRCKGWNDPLGDDTTETIPTLPGTWNTEAVWTIQRFPSAYGNMTFMDYRIPYKIGAQSYTTDVRVCDGCKDTSNWILFGGPAIWPDPDTPV